MRWPRLGGQSPVQSAASNEGKEAKDKLEDDKKDKDKNAADANGFFDPEMLERGASALKELDASPHATSAFQLAAMQEKTTQMASQKEAESNISQRMAFSEQLGIVQAEESRKTISHTADQERDTARYKAEVEQQLQSRKLEHQKNQLETQLQREHDQWVRQEAIRVQNELQVEEERKKTLLRKAELDREAILASAQAAAKGEAKGERENVEIRMREMRAKKAEERQTKLEAIEACFSGLSEGATALFEDRSKTVALVSGLTALALGVYGARGAIRVVSTVAEQRLGQPPLVRETSRWSLRPSGTTFWPWATAKKADVFENIVLEQELAERLRWTTNALLSAQDNGTPFRHLLLHGPPGTGKTLFARTLARQSGLDYAVMSGGDLGPLGSTGPNELHKLFAWAQQSKKGLILFIDEADAFLRRGRSAEAAMSEDARNALSVFLHHTGTESARIAVVLATNVPSVLDRAVLDRMDEQFEFPLPQYQERVQMMNMFMDRYILAPTKRGHSIQIDPALDDKFVQELAKKTEGFSGRQLAKLALAFQSAVFGSGTTKLTQGLAETVLSWRLANPSSN